MQLKQDGGKKVSNNMADSTKENTNEIIEEQLDSHINDLENELKADVLTFSGVIRNNVDKSIRDAVETRKSNKYPNRNTLFVILETSGGYIQVAQRIADIFRHHYKKVEFIIPNYAMSAGTVLAMSGDAIHMDYFSVLGPIDPQIEKVTGDSYDLIPALGYLVQYERLIKKSKAGELTTAEITFLVSKFDPAELYSYEQARELSITLLKEWLVKYKFKNWKKTRTRKLEVTHIMRVKSAEKIAKLLNNIERWHSHSRGISMPVLRRDLKLEIEDFGKNKILNEKIRTYYKLLNDYMMRMGQIAVLHRKGLYVACPYI